MRDVSKLQNLTLGIIIAAQLYLLFTSSPYIAAFAPPLVAAIPMGLLALRSDTIRKFKIPDFRSIAIIGGMLWGLAALSFFFPSDPSMKLQIARAIIVDGAVFYPVSLITIYFSTKRRRTSSSC